MSATKAPAASDETNPLGLHCIRSSTESLKPHFNLVLVHGHSGDAFSTWKHENGSSWPEEFLPLEDDMKNIVVWTWGYRAVEEKSQGNEIIVPSTIFGLGEELCGILHDNQVYHHPITFVGHGVGGIIIKSALNHSRAISSLSEIVNNTRQVVFLDTPHMGINIDALQKLNGGYLSDHVASEFGLWSRELEAQAKRFANIAGSFNISSTCASILESDGDTSKQIAPGLSAHTLILHERIFWMDRVRHEDICKFPHPEHVNYRRLRDRIRSGLSAVKDDDDRVGILWEWIGITNSSNCDQHKDNCEILNNHKGTCDWLFDNTRFQSWIAGSKSETCLWLTGPSGVGKTFLCSAAIKYVQQLPDRPGTVFEFVHFGDTFKKLEVLQRLAAGLLKRVDDCRALTETAIRFRNRARQDAEEMKGLVMELLRAAAAVGRVFLFIDGINEVASELSYDVNRKQLEKEEKEAKDLVRLLLQCAQSEPNVRLWFSSQSDDRTTGWLEQDVDGHNHMASKASVVKLNIPEIQSCNSVAKFLKATIETQLGTEKFGESAWLSLEVSKLLLKTGAADSFRWAAMMADAINTCASVEEVRKTIGKGLPSDLSKLYSKSLQRLQNLDMSDRTKRQCTGYSRAILSILTFARRPLRFPELQEAIASFCLKDHYTPTGFPNISSSSLILFDSLRNRCVPFVRYYSKDDKDTNGFFRLAHQSVYLFLLSVSNLPKRGSSTTTDLSSQPPMVDATFLANSCLNYLFQDRYARTLTKESALIFRAGIEDVRKHKFLQYAAKYWYRHVDDRKPDDGFSERVECFLRSPQFVTAIQVQSLFVPGHFIQDLDCDDPKKRNIKKNLPESLASDAYKELWNDYHEFLAEWGPFLQRGVCENVNGEIDRCLWSTLSATNYFRRYRPLQQFRMALVLEDGSDPSGNADRVLYNVTLTDELTVTVWRVFKSDMSDDDLELYEHTWTLQDSTPKSISYRKFLFSKAETRWELYDPGAIRAIRLLPSSYQAERVPPIAFTSSHERLRIGLAEFVEHNGHWLKEKDKAEAYGSTFWENIQVYGNWRVKSRRRLVEAESRFRKNSIDRSQSWSSDDDDASITDGFQSEDASQLSFGIESPTQSCNSVTDYSQESSGFGSELGTDESGSDGTNDESEKLDELTQDPSSSESESESDALPRVSLSPLFTGLSETQFTPHYVTDSELPESASGIDQATKKYADVTGLKRKLQQRVCDGCQAQPLSLFYECDICIRKDSYDLCVACLKAGHWCNDRFHQLYKTRLNSHGRLRRLGGLRLVDCRPDICILVERLDGATPVMFRYHESKSTRSSLYNSHPRFHPSNSLLIWPLGSWDMLCADIEENRYSIWPTHGGMGMPNWLRKFGTMKPTHGGMGMPNWLRKSGTIEPTHGGMGMPNGRRFELTVDTHFSTCGTFLYTLTVYATVSGDQPDLSIMLSAWSLSSKRPSVRPPKERAKTKVELGRWHRSRLADQPFSLTWKEEYVYVTCSSDRLCVYRLPLKTSGSSISGQDGHTPTKVTQPSNEITLPRTARCRRVQFFPSGAAELDGVIIIGPRDGERSASPIVINLPSGSLGIWKTVEKADDLDVSEEDYRKGESQFETFDDEDDCDLIPFDPKFRV